jgi:hypothetical protein
MIFIVATYIRKKYENVKFALYKVMKVQRGIAVYSYSFFNLSSRWG